MKISCYGKPFPFRFLTNLKKNTNRPLDFYVGLQDKKPTVKSFDFQFLKKVGFVLSTEEIAQWRPVKYLNILIISHQPQLARVSCKFDCKHSPLPFFPLNIFPLTIFPLTIFPLTIFPLTFFPLILFPLTISPRPQQTRKTTKEKGPLHNSPIRLPRRKAPPPKAKEAKAPKVQKRVSAPRRSQRSAARTSRQNGQNPAEHNSNHSKGVQPRKQKTTLRAKCQKSRTKNFQGKKETN